MTTRKNSILASEITTTDQVFNMNLHHAGTYAGEFQDEAIEALFDDEYMWTEESWADFMVDTKNGKLYVVKADGALTEHDTNALIAEVPDCEWENIWEASRDKVA